MAGSIVLRRSLFGAVALLSAMMAPASQAGVVTNSSGYITNVTNLSVGGTTYDVSFFGSIGNSAKIADQASLWGTLAEFQLAYTALLGEMNTISSSNSFVVFANDGSGALNNDFGVAGPNSTIAHLRAIQPGQWFLNVPSQSVFVVMAEFTPNVASPSPLPEPQSSGLVALAVMAAGLMTRAGTRKQRIFTSALSPARSNR